MKAFADLKEHGAEDLLKREYGDAFQETPEVSSKGESVCESGNILLYFSFIYFSLNGLTDLLIIECPKITTAG